MTFSIRSNSIFCKNSAYLLSAILLVACHPPAPANERHATDKNETVDTPLIISSDSVTMTSEYILDIKPSRYQPSLGLQGNIKPIKQIQLITARALSVERVLVTKGQWVEKGTPLLMVRHQVDTNKQIDASDETDVADSSSADLSKAATTGDTTIDTTSRSSSNNSDNSNSGEDSNRDSINAERTSKLVTVRASFSGRIDSLYTQVGQQVDARKPLLRLSDETDLRFIATLPIQAESQLSVGQTVNFTTKSLSEKFTGQVSNLVPSEQPDQLLVYVHVSRNDANRNILKPDMLVTGRVDYGQIEVGTIVPERALHDVDLTTLQTPPYQPLSPLTANVWIIKQDQRLTRQPVDVIKYDPNTGQYLIAGISNDSLICLADLPIESASKKVVIS